MFSQTNSDKDKVIYLDSTWTETSEGNHKYYRIIKDYYSNQSRFKILDYYKNGALQMEGFSKSKDYLINDGEFIWYYENGNKKQILNYDDSKVIGKGTRWYEDGLKKMECEYIINPETKLSELKINQFWDVENVHKVIDGNGIYQDIENDVYEKGSIKNGFRDGVWEGESFKIKYKFTETYNDSKLISGTSIDSNNETHSYTTVFLRPEPKRGLDQFYKYIMKKFVVNNEAYQKNIHGKLLFQFYVEKDGRVDEVKVLKSLGYGLDDEGMRLIRSYDKWMPGKVRGIEVRVSYSIPITIPESQ